MAWVLVEQYISQNDSKGKIRFKGIKVVNSCRGKTKLLFSGKKKNVLKFCAFLCVNYNVN